jgi:hypothetical protein
MSGQLAGDHPCRSSSGHGAEGAAATINRGGIAYDASAAVGHGGRFRLAGGRHLLDNALEASPDWVRLEAGIDGDRLIVVVRDRGSGFAPDLLGQIGKPYTTTKQRPGAGLGLFLVFNVVRKLGGTVDARSGGDGGAVVTIGLPLAALDGTTS